jgi:valyl-tRNA synthetase
MSELASPPPGSTEQTQDKAASKKDAKKAEKLAKFNAKAANKVTSAVGTSSNEKDPKKDKAPKSKKAEEPEYVNTTPPGQKKGKLERLSVIYIANLSFLL